MDFDLNIGTPIVTVSFHFGLTSCFIAALAIIFGVSVAYSDPFFQENVAHNIAVAQETLKDVKKQATEWFSVPAIIVLAAVLHVFGLL